MKLEIALIESGVAGGAYRIVPDDNSNNLMIIYHHGAFIFIRDDKAWFDSLYVADYENWEPIGTVSDEERN